MTTFRTLVPAFGVALLAFATTAITPPSAEARNHKACGPRSFVLGADGKNQFVSFHNGGRAYYNHPEKNIRVEGTWYWDGNDAVSVISGVSNHWPSIRTRSCDWTF